MSDQFVRDYQQDQYNQVVQEIRNRPIGGPDGQGRGGVGGGAGNAASWALLLAMLGAIVGAILGGTGGAIAVALVGAVIGLGDAVRTANAMTNWAVFGFVAMVGYKLFRRGRR